MEFNNEELEVRLVLPDEPTRRQLLRYDSNTEGRRLELYEKLWTALASIEPELECEYLSIESDLDEPCGDPRFLDAFKWVCLAVHTWRMDIESAEKN